VGGEKTVNNKSVITDCESSQYLQLYLSEIVIIVNLILSNKIEIISTFCI